MAWEHTMLQSLLFLVPLVTWASFRAQGRKNHARSATRGGLQDPLVVQHVQAVPRATIRPSPQLHALHVLQGSTPPPRLPSARHALPKFTPMPAESPAAQNVEAGFSTLLLERRHAHRVRQVSFKDPYGRIFASLVQQVLMLPSPEVRLAWLAVQEVSCPQQVLQAVQVASQGFTRQQLQ